MRSTKEIENFPYAAKTICYIELSQKGEIQQISCSKNEIQAAYAKAKEGKATLYAVWPGQYRSDLFLVDDLNALADAFGIDWGNEHIHDIEYSLSSFDDGHSLYAFVNIEFKCGCELHSNNIKAIAHDLKKQYGWEMATSTGYGCSTCNGKQTYSIRVRRKSMQ